MYKSVITGNSFYIVDDQGNRVFPVTEEGEVPAELDLKQFKPNEVKDLATLMADNLNWDNGRGKQLFTGNSIYLSPHTQSVILCDMMDEDKPGSLTKDQALYIEELLNRMPFISKGSVEICDDVISWEFNIVYNNEDKQEEAESFWDTYIRATLCMFGFYSPCDDYSCGSTVYPVTFICPECGSKLEYRLLGSLPGEKHYTCTNKSCNNYNKQMC